MRKQDIEIIISPAGEVTFTIKGVKGSSCVQETEFLEDAVGVVLERERTSEYFEQAELEHASSRVGDDGEDDPA